MHITIMSSKQSYSRKSSRFQNFRNDAVNKLL
uniref:Uncharacterized protein n=1 Tax=Arundo donax TaxID=35708 RepID=A0A0A9A9J2_ARUDO